MGFSGEQVMQYIIYSHESILVSVFQDDPLVPETDENYQSSAYHGGVQHIQ